MIRKYWMLDHPKYDAHFDKVSDNAWKVWKQEQTYEKLHDNVAWRERFGCDQLVGDKLDSWVGLKFKNKAHYVLFLLEWS